MFWYLIGSIAFLCVLHIMLNCNKRARMIYKVPGPKKYFVVANIFTFVKTPVELMRLVAEYVKTYKDLFSVWACPYGMVMVYNPDDVEIVLSSIKHSEKSVIYSFLKPWLGDGLLNSKGTKWHERRKILTPAFHFNILKQFFEIINENSELLIYNLNNTDGKSIDVLPTLSEFTLDTICETAMGIKLRGNKTDAVISYRKSIHHLAIVVVGRLVRLHLYPDFLFNLSSYGRRQRELLKTAHKFTESIINQRKDYIEVNGLNIDENSNDNDDTYICKKKKRAAMLDLLISAHKERLIDRDGIQEEVDTFTFEGHDTTASALTFCVMILANHREIQKKIQCELKDIFGYSKRSIKMEDLTQMKYMENCIKESLRMYPPVHFISRIINETIVLSNYMLPPKTVCNILIKDLHYLESIYTNPNKFDPDRFLPENSVGRHPYAYIPFSAGPRNCIGQKFAMMEMKIVIANILREFNLAPVTRPEDIRFTADIILRNNGPVLVKFIKRKQQN